MKYGIEDKTLFMVLVPGLMYLDMCLLEENLVVPTRENAQGVKTKSKKWKRAKLPSLMIIK